MHSEINTKWKKKDNIKSEYLDIRVPNARLRDFKHYFDLVANVADSRILPLKKSYFKNKLISTKIN